MGKTKPDIPGSITPKALGEAKLAESGLTPKDGKLLGYSFLTASQTSALCKSFRPLISLKLEYFDHLGKPLSDIPSAPPFYRIRYLQEVKSFSDVAKDKSRFPKYVQEPNTAPCAYFPKNQEWADIIEDVDIPLIFTEGEFKAAKACKEGFPTIGLGGVYNWRAKKLGILWLPSLEPVKLVRRNVYLVFDSDYKVKRDVCVALRQFADALQQRGAFVHIVTLPTLNEGEKTGLDDYFVSMGASGADGFKQLLKEAEPLGLARPLWELNSKYCYVQDPGLIVDQTTFAKTAPSAFTSHLQAPLTYLERSLDDEGNLTFKNVSAAGKWLKWPLRTEVNKITYKPGRKKFMCDGLPLFNIWPGWGVEPKAGNAAKFISLIDHIFTGAEPGAKEWFLKWCAYPLQYPGTKLFSSCVIHGIVHGTGKSLIGYTLGKIYGKNFSEISQMDLHNSFNEWAEAKQFVMGDDVTGSNKRADADFLKKLITQQELRVNPKYIASYVVPDCINYFFTSNSPDSFFLEDHDRRFFIHEVLAKPKDAKFYTDYVNWLNKDGAANVFQFLLDLDISDFNPAAPALKTEAKDRMINTVQSDLGEWCRALRENPDAVLKVGQIHLKRDLYTSAELLRLFYDPERAGKVTPNGLSRELQRAGFRQLMAGKPIKLTNKEQVRYFAVRNVDKWSKVRDIQSIVEHIENVDKGSAKGKKY